MYPLLQDGDVLDIRKVKFNAVEINDILCVRKNQATFTHRVIYKKDNYLILKGDTNLVSDGKIYEKNVIGKVAGVIRNGNNLDPEDLYLIQSSIYLKEIIEVKKTFEKKKINYVFLKGLPLHLYYTGTHPRRLYADCDILIDKKMHDKASSLLNKLGFTKINKGNQFIKSPVEKQEISFVKYVSGFRVELDIHLEIVFMSSGYGHLNYFYPTQLVNTFTKEILKHKRIISVKKQRFPILDSSYLLVYLMLHLFHHKFRSSWRFEIIDKVLGKEKIDFKKASEIVDKYHYKNFIYPGIILYCKYFDNKFPDWFMKKIKPDEKTLKFITEKITNKDIFNDVNTLSNKKTEYFFRLSPLPLYRKALVIFDPPFVWAGIIYFANISFQIIKLNIKRVLRIKYLQLLIS